MIPLIVFMGAPGSGKGTQVQKLAKYLNIEKISTGDLIRKEMDNKTDIGKAVEPIMTKGNLIPDELMNQIFENNISEEMLTTGFIVDGYPRTMNQAKSLDVYFKKYKDRLEEKVFFLDVGFENLKSRIDGRKNCTECKVIYHNKFNPPRIRNICNECGAGLVERKDDSLEILQNRYEIFQERVEPLINYYQDRIIKINGNEEIDKIFEKNIVSV